MVIIRNARLEDIVAVQNANLQSLPENYQMRYYLYHFLTWPELTHVAENFEGKIVGYVLGKLDDSNKNADYRYGMITSVAINRHYRKLGLATRLMRRTLAAMKEVYDIKYVTLHVRAGNDAAKHLYQNVLKFEKEYVEEGYYADEKLKETNLNETKKEEDENENEKKEGSNKNNKKKKKGRGRGRGRGKGKGRGRGKKKGKGRGKKKKGKGKRK
ncbi:n-terminal acetyltransferase [Anaeramoeba flamelloides]|uniref:N-terminal acetyltransferase n=1 Tax=Anaeramoeba flamelloides TaxID=1746091 RepID=A0ABQ8X7L0_9EUKA|nr:n-terminal acetyltransferase [Anaeramoeba flamelloides]